MKELVDFCSVDMKGVIRVEVVLTRSVVCFLYILPGIEGGDG